MNSTRSSFETGPSTSSVSRPLDVEYRPVGKKESDT